MARPRLEDLFDTHHARLYRLACRMLHDAQEAQDAVQEAFLRAARTIERLPPGEQGAEAWLVRVLVNLCRDRHRRQRVRGFPTELSGEEVAPGSRPDDAVVAKRTVQVALATLPPRRRAVVVLHELEGRETREIASLLGLAPVTVRWHLAAGRAQLAKLLVPQCEE